MFNASDNESTLHSNFTLTQLNAERAKRYYPAIGYVSCCILLGFIGNILVWYVYGTKFARTPANTFIIVLAVYDLINCTVAFPYEIMDMLFPYMYGDILIIPCKIIRFIEHTVTVGSATTLLCISYERMRKICNPLVYFSIYKTKVLVALTTLYAVCESLPVLFLDGYQQKETGVDGVIGSDCSRDKNKHFNTFYQVIVFSLFMFFSLLHVVFYLRIGITLCRKKDWAEDRHSEENHVRFGKVTAHPVSNEIHTSSERYQIQPSVQRCVSTHKESLGQEQSEKGGTEISPDTDTSSSRYIMSGDTVNEHEIASTQNNPIHRTTNKTTPSQCNRTDSRCIGGTVIRPKRLTLILFLVTVSCYLSFLPVIVVELMGLSDRLEEKRREDATMDMLLSLFQKSYCTTVYINVIIYSTLNKTFRKKAKDALISALRCERKNTDRSRQQVYSLQHRTLSAK